MIENLEARVELEANQEWNNPTDNFGDRLTLLVEAETGETLDPELVFEFNHWQDLWLDPVLGWREFIQWVWRKIVAWWKSLWD